MIYQLYTYTDFAGDNRVLFSESKDLNQNEVVIWYEAEKQKLSENLLHAVVDQNHSWFKSSEPTLLPTVEEINIPNKEQLCWEDISEIVKQREIEAMREKDRRQKALNKHMANFIG
jgi:hypothetical protein